jgi:hypothetical protein
MPTGIFFFTAIGTRLGGRGENTGMRRLLLITVFFVVINVFRKG